MFVKKLTLLNIIFCTDYETKICNYKSKINLTIKDNTFFESVSPKMFSYKNPVDLEETLSHFKNMTKKIIDANFTKNAIEEYSKNKKLFMQKVDTIHFCIKTILLFLIDPNDDLSYCYYLEYAILHFFVNKLYSINEIVEKEKSKKDILIDELEIQNIFYKLINQFYCNIHSKITEGIKINDKFKIFVDEINIIILEKRQDIKNKLDINHILKDIYETYYKKDLFTIKTNKKRNLQDKKYLDTLKNIIQNEIDYESKNLELEISEIMLKINQNTFGLFNLDCDEFNLEYFLNWYYFINYLQKKFYLKLYELNSNKDNENIQNNPEMQLTNCKTIIKKINLEKNLIGKLILDVCINFTFSSFNYDQNLENNKNIYGMKICYIYIETFYDNLLESKCNRDSFMLENAAFFVEDHEISSYFNNVLLLDVHFFNSDLIYFKLKCVLISKIALVYFLRMIDLKTFWEQDVIKFLNKQNETIETLITKGNKKDDEILVKINLSELILEKNKKTLSLIENYKTINNKNEKKKCIEEIILRELLIETKLCGMDNKKFLKNSLLTT
ncbi:hypothetical protein NUSPORA_02364 [Nucleospora cyclopteri]